MEHVFYSLFEKMCVSVGERRGGKGLREVWNFTERASIVLIKAVKKSLIFVHISRI